MSQSPGDPLASLEGELRRSDPEFARAFRIGRPCRPREYRNRPARTVLALVLALGGGGFVYGAVFGQGLLLASGLVTVGVAAHLLDPARVRTPRRRGSGRRGSGAR